MILPVGAKSFKEALCIGCEVGAIWSDPFCCVFPTRWDRTRPGLPFVEELHQEEVRTGLVADVDFDTHVPPVSCLETKDACNVGDEARSVTIWKWGAKWCPNPPKSVLWSWCQTMRSSRHCPCVICAISIGRADLHHLCKTTTRLWSTRWLQKMVDLPTIYPIDEHMGLQWLPVPKFQIHMEMIGPVSSIGCINRVHHVESNGFSTSMEQLRKHWGSSSCWQPRWAQMAAWGSWCSHGCHWEVGAQGQGASTTGGVM